MFWLTQLPVRVVAVDSELISLFLWFGKMAKGAGKGECADSGVIILPDGKRAYNTSCGVQDVCCYQSTVITLAVVGGIFCVVGLFSWPFVVLGLVMTITSCVMCCTGGMCASRNQQQPPAQHQQSQLAQVSQPLPPLAQGITVMQATPVQGVVMAAPPEQGVAMEAPVPEKGTEMAGTPAPIASSGEVELQQVP